jgi:hypothetical protein
MTELETAEDQPDERNENQEEQKRGSKNQYEVILDAIPNVRAFSLSENCGGQKLS